MLTSRPSDGVEHLANCGRELAPGAGFCVETRAAVVLGGAPARLDPAAALEPMERRVQRALLDVERRAGDLVEALGDGPSVLRLEGHGLEDQEIEGPLWKIQRFVCHSACPAASTGDYMYSCRSARG